MASLSTCLLLTYYYLQLNVIYNVDGFTLPLQTITTKCESFTKKPQKLNQEIISNDKVVANDNLNASADFSSRANNITIPSIVDPVLNSVFLASQENYCNVLPVTQYDLTLTFSDNAKQKTNILPTSSDFFISTKNSMHNAEPNTILGSSNVCENNSKNFCLNSPNIVPNSVAFLASPGLTLKPSVHNNESKFDIPIQASTITMALSDSMTPLDLVKNNLKGSCYLNSPSPGLKLPLSVSSSTTNFESNLKSVLSTQNVVSSSGVNPQSLLTYDMTDFPPPPITPTFLFKPKLPLAISPNDDLPLLSGITMPLSVTSSTCSLDSSLNLNKFLNFDLEKSMTHNLSGNDLLNIQISKPLDSNCKTLSSTSDNIIEVINNQKETLAAASKISYDCLSPSVIEPPSGLGTSNSNLSSPLCNYLKNIMPQPFLSNNVFPTKLNPMSGMSASTMLPNESHTNISSSSNLLPSSCIYPALPCLNQDQDSSILSPVYFEANNLLTTPLTALNMLPFLPSLISPSSNLPQPILLTSPLTSENLIYLDNKPMLAPQCDENIVYSTISPCTLISESQKPEKTSTLSVTNHLNTFVTPAQFSGTGFADDTRIPVTSNSFESKNPNVQTFPQSNIYLKSDQFDSFASTLPDSKLSAMTKYDNPLRPLDITLNRNSPLQKYFTDVRDVTAKLDDFISSFNSRIRSRKTVPLSFANILRTPKTLLQPNIMPILEPVEPEIPDIVTFDNNPAIFESSLTVKVPEVPQTLLNIYNYPRYSTPVQYDCFQDDIASLSYSNFLPFSFNSLPTDIIPPNLYTNLDSSRNLPFLSCKSIFKSFAENPYSRQSFYPEINKNWLDSEFAPVINKNMPPTSLPVNTSSTLFPRKHFPYISSISLNTAPICEKFVESKTDLPSLSSLTVAPSSSYMSPTFSQTISNGPQIDLCSKEIQRMIDLLELSMMLNGESGCDPDSLTNILSSL